MADLKRNFVQPKTQNKLKMSTEARRRALLKARGLADPHLNRSEFMKLKEKVGKFGMYVSIGHGTHLPAEPPVLIPHNVYVVFFTPPGYWGNIFDTLEQEFINILRSRKLFLQMIRGTLPSHKIPTIIRTKKWDWTHHIYPPGTYSENHLLEFFDPKKGTTEDVLKRGLYTRYDGLCGSYMIGEMSRRAHYGETKNLQQLVDGASL